MHYVILKLENRNKVNGKLSFGLTKLYAFCMPLLQIGYVFTDMGSFAPNFLLIYAYTYIFIQIYNILFLEGDIYGTIPFIKLC